MVTKQKIEVELDVPDDFEATGEFRAPKCGEYYISDVGEVRRVPQGLILGPRVILRKVEPEYRECQGPRDWPAMGWAAKDEDGEWYLFSGQPYYEDGHWVMRSHGADVRAELAEDWEIPPNIQGLPADKSLTKLRHTCRWRKRPSGMNLTECSDGIFSSVYDHCPSCGRKVELVEERED